MQGPQGKYLFGLVKIGEKGQIVIPKEAREVFGLKSGDQLLMLGDEKQGIALVKPDTAKIFETHLPEINGDAPADRGAKPSEGGDTP